VTYRSRASVANWRNVSSVRITLTVQSQNQVPLASGNSYGYLTQTQTTPQSGASNATSPVESRFAGAQRGASLIVSLILLAVIALLVVYGAKPLLTEQKIASNQNDRNMAFQLAELGLKAGESYVAANKPAASSFVADCTGGFACPASRPAVPMPGSAAMCLAALMPVAAVHSCTITTDTLQKPRYTVELLDSNYSDAVTGSTGASLYRITSRAWGRNANTQVTLQSYYVVS
jgi:type IV pilus assembly protein PilX